MNTLSTDEMERFQKLSNEFEADVQVYWREKTDENCCPRTPADTLGGRARSCRPKNQPRRLLWIMQMQIRRWLRKLVYDLISLPKRLLCVVI